MRVLQTPAFPCLTSARLFAGHTRAQCCVNHLRNLQTALAKQGASAASSNSTCSVC